MTQTAMQPNHKLYESYCTKPSLDLESLKTAEKLFEQYHKEHVILNNSFHDDEWVLYDGYLQTHLKMRFSEIAYHRNIKPFLGFGLDAFKSYYKIYITMTLSQYVPNHYREQTNALKQIFLRIRSRLIRYIILCIAQPSVNSSQCCLAAMNRSVMIC